MKRQSLVSWKRPHKHCPLFVLAAFVAPMILIGMLIVADADSVPSLKASYGPATATTENEKLPPFRSEPGQGKFLIAAKKLIDPNFSETVVLLVDYGSHGAMGLVINRPTGIRLSTVLPDIKGLKDRPDLLFMAGPVQKDMLMLLVKTSRPPKEAYPVFEDVFIGAKPEIIQQMIDRSDATERFRAFAGYAGWSPGQLEREIARGDWHILRADSATVFDKEDSKIWPDLIRLFTSKWVNIPSHQNRANS